MVVRRVLAFVVPLAVGAMIGAVFGGIITGDEGYALVCGLGIPVVIFLVIIFGASNASSKKKTEPAPDRPVRLRKGIALTMVALGAALVLIPAYTMIGWVVNDTLHGRPFDGRDMRTGLHQDDAIAQIAQVVGTTDITYAGFYDSYVIVTARTSPRSDTADTYMWRYGGAFRSGPAGFQPDLASELFDASKVDFSIIPRLITLAKRDAGMNDSEDFYPSVRRGPDGDGGLGDPVISLSLSNDYFDAYYTFSLDGEIISKSGTAFE